MSSKFKMIPLAKNFTQVSQGPESEHSFNLLQLEKKKLAQGSPQKNKQGIQLMDERHKTLFDQLIKQNKLTVEPNTTRARNDIDKTFGMSSPN